MQIAPIKPVLVDVLVPAFNCEDTIVESVDSILSQTERDIRIIVIDDGSTDETARRVLELSQTDARIVLLRQSNGGIVEALNNGLSICTAPFIARHDGDDIAYPDRFRQQLVVLANNPRTVAVSANARHINSAGAPTGTETDMRGVEEADPAWFPAREPYLMHPLLMMRREALIAAGGYRHVLHTEDADLYWRLLKIGHLQNMPQILADYRIHVQSVTGASVINGRIAAVNSQLCALSYVRRLRGEKDMVFSYANLKALNSVTSLADMIEIAEVGLSVVERNYLRLASVAKLVEFVLYRPYELDAEDWKYIRKTAELHGHSMTRKNAIEFRLGLVWYTALLLKRGRFGVIMRDAPKWIYVPLSWHLLKVLIAKPRQKIANAREALSQFKDRKV